MANIGVPLKEWQIDESPLPEPSRNLPIPEHESQENIPQETEKELEKRIEEVETV